jgi:peptidoglycan/LPS O-acetylase OafA/YrhL
MTGPSTIVDRFYRPDIDGLRAIAILSVVLYHTRVPLITGGFTGVDIFFVISGYLIGGHIFSELRSGTFSFIRFYQRRAKRILPAFYAVLAFAMLTALLLLTPSEAKEFGRSAFAATMSVSNVLFWRITDYFNPTNELNPLLMTWSLGVEEQFYFVIPLLMVLLARLRRGLLMPSVFTICAISFLFACLELPKHPLFVFYMLPSRAWELGVGVALAVVEFNRKRSVLSGPLVQAMSAAGMVLMLVPMFVLTKATPFPGMAALPSVLGTALVIAAPVSWMNQRLLSLRPLVFVGRVSYSFYLWHWPLLAFAHILGGDDLPSAASALVVAAAFAVGVLSYYLVEQPLRRSHRAPAPLLLRYAAVSVAILAACAVVWQSRGLPQRFPAMIRTEGLGEDEQAFGWTKCGQGNSDLAPAASPVCYDTSGAGPKIAVWGDSHAAVFSPGLRSTSVAQGYGFVRLTRGGCPPLTGATIYFPKRLVLGTWCSEFNSESLRVLEADHSIPIVILAGFWNLYLSARNYGLTTDPAQEHKMPTRDASRALLEQSLRATILSLRASGKLVIVFEDVPNFAVDPVSRVRNASIPARRALSAMLGTMASSDPGFAPPEMVSAAAMADSAIEQAVTGLQGVALYDPRPEFCSSPTHCAYRNGERLLYYVKNHVNADGARYALRDFRLPYLSIHP